MAGFGIIKAGKERSECEEVKKRGLYFLQVKEGEAEEDCGQEHDGDA